jgi:hypothetical protein
MRKSSQKTQMSNPRVTQAPSEPAMLSRNSLLFEARTETISFVKSSFHKLARQSLKKQVHKLHPERKKSDWKKQYTSERKRSETPCDPVRPATTGYDATPLNPRSAVTAYRECKGCRNNTAEEVFSSSCVAS